MENVTGPLKDIAVLDLSETEPGLFAAQLLADMGADVIRIERGRRMEGQPRGTLAGEIDPFRLALLRNRRIVEIGQTEQERAENLRIQVAKSAVLLIDGADGRAMAGTLDSTECFSIQPSLVRCSISPFGVESPWSDRFGGDLTVQALAGAMELTGEPGRPPVRMGAPVLAMMTGAEAAVAILSCLFDETQSGPNAIDVSILDVALSMLSYIAPMYLTLGAVPERVGSGHPTIYPYNAFEVADGYLVAAPFTQRFWRNFCQVLGSPEWAEDERFRDFQHRLDNRGVLAPLLNGRMKEKTRDEWLRLLEAGDVPCGPAHSVAEALGLAQTRARGLVVEVNDESGNAVSELGFPLKITNADGHEYQPTYQHQRASASDATAAMPIEGGVGENGAHLPGRSIQAPDPTHDDAGSDRAAPKPLSGIRVVDLTRMAAGPFCTEMLADLGAEVVKVEEPRIGDPTRRNVPMINGLSSYFYAFNRGKKSVAVDMKEDAGRELVLKLIAEADVVVENFRPGVVERLGLDFETVKKENDRIVFASISGFGQTGPLREKTSFDLVNQAMAGMLSVTGEPDRDPVRLGLPVGDLAGGVFACLGITAALNQRKRTGVGAYIDVSLHDVLVVLLGGIAQDFLSSGTESGRIGSEHPHQVPAAVFATSDGFVAIEAWTDEAWQELVAEVGSEQLREARFADLDARSANRAELSQILGKILIRETTAEWLHRLDKPGIGVAPICGVPAALDSEHVAARGLVVTNELPGGGDGRTIGSAFRLNGRRAVSVDGPPTLGQHNELFLDPLKK